jgi:hypothetical protein
MKENERTRGALSGQTEEGEKEMTARDVDRRFAQNLVVQVYVVPLGLGYDAKVRSEFVVRHSQF